MSGPGDAEVHRTPDRAILGVVFLLVFAFSYSEEIVIGLFNAIGQGDSAKWRIALIVADLGILFWAAMLKRSISRTDQSPPRLWRSWWMGFAIIIALDVGLSGLPETPPVWINVLSSTLLTVAMAVLLVSSIDADPLTLFSSSRRAALPRDWRRVRAVMPLAVGVLAAFLGATVFADYFDFHAVRTLDPHTAAQVAALPLSERLSVNAQLCKNAINPFYFQHVVGLLPVLLLTLGVELNRFRRTLLDPAQRATTAATVTVMSVALLLGLSTLPWDGTGCGEVLARWHEYLAFEVSLQAVFTALATLVWVLFINAPGQDPLDESRALKSG